MRTLLVMVTFALASSGCFLLGGPAVIGTTTAFVPPIIGATAMPMERSTAHATFAGVSADGAPDHRGGWGVSLDTSSVAKGYIAHGKVELGQWGRDRFYGSSGADAGIGFGASGFGAGLMIGYGYGGFVQNGHRVPLTMMGFAKLGPVSLRLSGYVGWRFGVHDEYPHAASSVGLGWNTFGAELSTIVVVRGEDGNGGGLSVGLGMDRQDDVDIAWLKIGLGVAIAQYAQ